ncbi:P-loop containing nucleoside triphosphate hydrolase protein [Hygrophoropsis aurantiaca]|uniref:P-loop containing nucleoside triphosphate hydrolase protein n=1 Tax=Hygrophoropsis aurantiaca TaxID=72124 RepID=A0ACB7ZYN9_9AGAM|nr:P-loop containing nucleoside triphosphate hydrolase protein [Hygrophoropsis aurantiaca]
MPSTIPGIPNIIIFGETGSGKSSLVNLIAGKRVAKTSSGASGCTLDAKSYLVPIGTGTSRLWDTVGLTEPSLSANGYIVAIEKAYKLICHLEHEGGITLLMFCMRGGRITAAAQNNYRLFFDIFCNKEVPIAFILTNLENEPSMEGWWEAKKKQFDRFGMHSDAHACVIANPGLDNFHMDRYLESRQRMHELLLSQMQTPARKREKTEWFTRLSGTRNWVFRRSTGSSRPSDEELVKKLTRRCGFSEIESQYISRKMIVIKSNSLDLLNQSDESYSIPKSHWSNVFQLRYMFEG